MAKKQILEPVLACLAQIWAPKIFLRVLALLLVDIVPSYHLMQFRGKLINQTWENGKKPNFGPEFGPFWPKFSPQKFFRGFYLY